MLKSYKYRKGFAGATLGILIVLFSLFTAVAAAQQNPTSSNPRRMQSADEEIDRQVFLSADRIVELLRNEPGLMLKVKRALVRRAYEQGRLLDPADLTDDAVFRLLYEDDNVRVLATKEIVDRGYVRAKPNEAEIEQENAHAATMSAITQQQEEQATAAKILGRPPRSQEEAYWAVHEKELEEQRKAQQPASAPPPRQTAPPVEDSRRAVNRAEMQQLMDELPSDSGSLPRIRPEEMPGLLAAQGARRASLQENGGGLGTFGAGASRSDAALAAMQLQSLRDSQAEQPVEEARLERQNYPQLNPPYFPRQDHPTIRHRANPYANVPSLYDLYSQVSKRSPVLQRFGEDIFLYGTGNSENLPMDVPVGPDYVLGPGDSLTIDMWGSVSQRLRRVVDREGRVALPEVGTVLVAGRSLGDVQHQVQSVLRTQYRDVQADVSLGRLRSVRVYVVGDVVRPGAYDISALSTPLNAIYAAGGPTENGSLRSAIHKRGSQVVETVDLYDLILHGTRNTVQPFQPGDSVVVPPKNPEVRVEGMVRRPAIYELRDEKNLAEVLELAGGVLPTGTLRHIDVERIEAHQGRKMLSLDIPDGTEESARKTLEGFNVQDGDKVRIAPILPYSEKTVYLDGHVFHPGKYPFREGMRVADLVKYSDLLPEPYKKHAEIIRLNPPDFRPVVMSFDLGEAMSGKDKEADLQLQPFDTIRVFGRFDFEDLPIITVSGEVRSPGEHRTNGETHLSDAIYLAGGTTPDTQLDDVQVYRRTDDGKLQVISANLSKALAGDVVNNVLLQPKDRVIVQRNMAKLDPPAVMIEGEVARPGKYPLGTGMTATELVRVAGGFKRSAFTDSADLSRYVLQNGSKVLGEHEQVAIAKAMSGDPDADMRLHDGDVLTIRQIAGWKDIGASITVRGEVVHPGVYGIHEGERLSSVLKRVGGFRPSAYPYAAVFEREQVRELGEKNRQDLIHRIESGQDIKIAPDTSGQEQAALLQAAMQQQQQVLQSLKNQPASGRMVIHLSKDIGRWANTNNDIEVRAGDVLIVPKPPEFVLVTGQVYNSSAITFVPGKDANWYLRQAGGPTQLANRKAIFVIRADGSIVGRNDGGWWSGNALSAKLRPGDTVVVPEKFITGSSMLKTLLSTAQVMSSMAMTAAVVLK